jgi:hypothetical protein
MSCKQIGKQKLLWSTENFMNMNKSQLGDNKKSTKRKSQLLRTGLYYRNWSLIKTQIILESYDLIKLPLE